MEGAYPGAIVRPQAIRKVENYCSSSPSERESVDPQQFTTRCAPDPKMGDAGREVVRVEG